ncbi:MAG: type VI secretion system tip protein VgrG, partial [Deltaproteobacteria bacterium]|nr:type VI secretion system tip protein VgrG [Deltaproteobacteria bacterium]
AHRWQISREPPKRKYCLQYRESNLAFVSRLLEFEGIYYSVESDGSLLLDDDSSGAPMVEGQTEFTLLEHAGMLEGGELGIHQFGSGARVRSGKATVGDFSWKTPKVTLRETAAADRDGELETYDCPAGFRKPADGAFLAQTRLQAHRAGTRFCRGVGNVVAFAAGRRFGFDGRELLLTGVRHEVRDPAYDDERDGESFTYQNHFEAIDSSVTFRPELQTAQPRVQGCHTVMVRGPVGEEIHTDAYGRFRAQFHWDREAKGTDDDSRWLRKLQESATSINLARVGWEVSVAYIDGDPDRPVGLHRDINGQMVPAYAAQANKEVMTIKTPTYPGGGGYNEIKLDDRGGAQEFNWRAEKDMLNQVCNDKTCRVGQNENRIVEQQVHHKVMHDQQVTVGANRTISVVKDKHLNVAADRCVTIAGNQTVSTDTAYAAAVNGNDTENVGSLRFSLVGEISLPKIDPKSLVPDPKAAAKSAGKAAIQSALGGGGASGAASAAQGSLTSMVPTTPEGAANQLTGGLSSGNLMALFNGSISRAGQDVMNRTVGAVQLSVSAESVDSAARYVHVETIGGAKISLAKKDISQSVGKVMATTVGGAIFRKCKGDMGYGSEKTKVTVGGLAKLDTTDNVEMNAEEVTLEATTEMKLASSELEIVLKPDVIQINGPLRVKAGTKVTVTGSDDDLTGGDGG